MTCIIPNKFCRISMKHDFDTLSIFTIADRGMRISNSSVAGR